MFRYHRLIVLGLLMILALPGAASAQFIFHGPRPFFANPVPHAYFGNPALANHLGTGYLNSAVAARGLYTNAYLNNVVGNINATYANVNGALYGNALLTNALLGNTNTGVVNQLATAYAHNITNATNAYVNAYANQAFGNALRYNAATNAGVYNTLTPRYNVATAYNPFTNSLATYSAYGSPFGGMSYNVNLARLNTYANPYMYNGYVSPQVNPYAYNNPYIYNQLNTYAYVNSINPYTYNPYLYGYVNPYLYYNPASVLYNPYLYTPGAAGYSGFVNGTNPYSSISNSLYPSY